MNLAAVALRNRVLTYFVGALLVLGGVASFLGLGQLEDPEFSIKNAVISTTYPGASPAEVEEEVTDLIEIALQELAEIDNIESFSKQGLSIIRVEVKPEYWADRLPQVWDQLRRKIRDIEGSLPPGAGRPHVDDDFGDVFGFQLAVVGDGFDYADLEDYAEQLKKELSLVEGVARVDLWGAQTRVVYLDVRQTQLAELGLTFENIASTLRIQNAVVDAGSVDLATRRLRIAPTGSFQSASEIGDLIVNAGIVERAQGSASSANEQLLRIKDIGTVREGYAEPAFQIMRFGGETSVGLSIANESGVNIVEVGEALEQRLAELNAQLPIGIEVHKVHWQSEVVSEAVNGFLLSFAEALAIVIVIIALFMGWRMGVIIGFALTFTILATFIVMALFGIDLQRVSLGALVVALGMMVDNAIVVADGYLRRTQDGMAPEEAASEAARVPAFPLLGATVVAVMAFYPIFASVEDVGEYCRTLFTVIAISLLVSWLVSVTLTPLQCVDLLKPDPKGSAKDPYGGTFFRVYRGFLERTMAFRWVTLTVVLVLMVGAVSGFANVRQLFFPASTMEKFMVDFWAPEGTRIEVVAERLRSAERHLLADERVEAVATFVGSGPPRFYLPVEPELPNPSYGQLIVNVRDSGEIDDILRDLNPWLIEAYPDSLSVTRKYGVGPANTWKLEARLIGPADVDASAVRDTAAAIIEQIGNDPLSAYVRTDWRQRVQMAVPVFNQERARWASVTRDDLAATTKRAFDGRTIGLYRERDELIPIILRNVEQERRNVAGLDLLQIAPALSTATVPVAEVIDGVEAAWEDPLIWRRDRRRTITIQSNPVLGVTAAELQQSVSTKVEAIDLPDGFTLEWGGDHESSTDANASLAPGIIPAIGIISIILVGLFNALRPSVVITFTVPLALIGITPALLAFDVPFGFMALLGAMSLAGMMIKNAIVLIDQIEIERAAGIDHYEAVVRSAMSRLRPVMLAAGTTVLGVIPLLQDVFWVGMAVTIMGGLTAGSVLMMVVMPSIYAVFYGIPSPKQQVGEVTA